MAKGTLNERRPSCKGLAPLVIRRNVGLIPRPDGDESDDDVIEEGKELFEHFVFQEIRNEGTQTPDDISTPPGYKNPQWAKTGRELRVLADAFAKTKERQRVRKKASQVDVGALTYEEFRDMLKELFHHGGFTKERIVVLFFYCSDLAIRSLKASADLFRRLLNWSLSFITEKVCCWVRSQGGWKKVVEDSANFVTKVLFCVGIAVIVSLSVKRILLAH